MDQKQRERIQRINEANVKGLIKIYGTGGNGMNEKTAVQDRPINFKVYTLKETANILGVAERTLLDYLKKGRIKGQKIGGHWKISENNLQSFIDGD